MFARSALILGLLTASFTSVRAVELTWRVDRRANEFWISDQLSMWSEQRTQPQYRDALRTRIPMNDARARLFSRYGVVRRQQSQETEAREDAAFPFGGSLLSPSQLPAFERFALSFLDGKPTLPATELAVVQAFLEDLRPSIGKILDDATYLAKARRDLEALAQTHSLATFMDRVAKFYGIANPDKERFTVELLWAPDGHGNATVYGNRIILPLSHQVASDPEDLASWLGVLVHEVGHHFQSRLPLAERRRITDALFERYGLPNESHMNVFEEAVQTALGNIIFVRDHLPATAIDSLWFYTWEPHNARPDAIDTLARALEPVVRKHLDTPGAFGGAFLDDALEVYARVFGNRPRNHGHAGLALASSKVRGYLRGLFWSSWRSVFSLDTIRDFADASKENQGITRWILLLEYEASDPVLEQLSPAMGAALALPSAQAACTWAKRRAPGRGYDFVVLGRDRDAIRRMMLTLFEDVAVSERAPRCIR